MKTLLTLFVLLFSSLVFADDISDFEIEGMSVGGSLLDYYSEEEITSWQKRYHEKSKKFVRLLHPRIFGNKYDTYNFYVKDKDNEYIIHSLKGAKYFGKNNIENCKKYKNEIVSDLISLFIDFEPINYNHIYDYVEDGKSVAYITDFDFDNGSIRIWCVDWSKVTEDKRNYEDNVSVDMSSRDFLNWLTYEAN